MIRIIFTILSAVMERIIAANVQLRKKEHRP